MPINPGRNVAVISIVTFLLLAAVLSSAVITSHAALLHLNDTISNSSTSPAIANNVEGRRPNTSEANDTYGKLPLSFEANQGQTDGKVKFLSRGSGYSLFLTNTEAVLSLHKSNETKDSNGKIVNGRDSNGVLRMKLVDSNQSPLTEGTDELPGKSNYFIGNNPKNWRTNVSTFGSVTYHDVYPGVDVVYYGNQRQLENDYVVAPAGNPAAIKLAFEGAKAVSVADDGSLVLDLAGESNGDVRLQKPVIYQLVDGVRHEIAGSYVVKNQGEVGFDVGP